MCPASSEPLEDRRQVVPAKHLPEASSYHFRGLSSFRRLNYSETTPPSESIAIPSLILSVPGKTNETTDLLDHHLYSRRSLRCQIIPSFKLAITPIPTQTFTENSRNHSYNQEYNPGHYKEISTCKSCSYENPYDSHHQ